MSWVLNVQLLVGKHSSIPDESYRVLALAGSRFCVCERFL